MIPSLTPNPSISTRSWFSVCSLSSWPPPMPVPRRLATASISSMNTIQGAFRFACSNRSRTREAPTPTNISTKSEPEMLKNGTPASPATAFAKSVLPVPGGPTRRIPLGILAPRLVYFFGSFKKSTTSSSSSFSSSRPATCLKVTGFFLLSAMVARLFPKFAMGFALPPPAARLFIMIKIRKNPPNIKSIGRMVVIR